MKLSYDELRRIYRLEKNSSRLAEVDEDFYNSLNDFVEQEKKAYLKSLKNFSISNTREFTNLKKIVEEIFLLRKKKIVNQALVANRTEEPKELYMALQEKRFFKQLLKVFSGHSIVLDELFLPEEEKARKKSKDLNTLSVQILKDVPSFVGTNMEEYGPFSNGQAVELPFKVAKLLTSRKLAELKKS